MSTDDPQPEPGYAKVDCLDMCIRCGTHVLAVGTHARWHEALGNTVVTLLGGVAAAR